MKPPAFGMLHLPLKKYYDEGVVETLKVQGFRLSTKAAIKMGE